MNQAPKYGLVDKDFSLLEMAYPVTYQRFMDLYKKVGEAYGWTDRLYLEEAALEALINHKDTHLYLLMVNGKEVGFTEMRLYKDFVELQYFGLFTTEIGQGFGPPLLQLSIEKAWSWGKASLHLNTCDLDHPKALGLYKKMGFEEVRRETKIRTF